VALKGVATHEVQQESGRMGKMHPQDRERARYVLSQSFSTPSTKSNAQVMEGTLWFFVAGTFAGEISVEGSLDGGVTWAPVLADSAGSRLALSETGMLSIPSPEAATLMRLGTSASFSGTALARLSGGWAPAP
jgi:hypothetical protein